jgi:hypothetical protein
MSKQTMLSRPESDTDSNIEDGDLLESVLNEMNNEEGEQEYEPEMENEQEEYVDDNEMYEEPPKENINHMINNGASQKPSSILKEDSLFNKVLKEITDPVIVTTLFILLNLDISKNFISQYIPFIVSEYGLNKIGVLIIGILAGICFFVYKKCF